MVYKLPLLFTNLNININELWSTHVQWVTYNDRALKYIKSHALELCELAYSMNQTLSKQFIYNKEIINETSFVINFNLHAIKYAYDFLIVDSSFHKYARTIIDKTEHIHKKQKNI